MKTAELELTHQVQVGVDLDQRTLYVVGEINEGSAYRAMVGLERLDRADGDIRIVLNSEGGHEQAGYAIYDTITMCRNHVTIDGYGSVMSIAAAIFQAGDVRRISPHCIFMIHNGSIAAGEGAVQQNMVLDLAEQIRRGNERYYDILSRGSKQSIKVIEEWCKNETFFNSEETVSAGFADEVIVPMKLKQAPRKRKPRVKPPKGE